MNGEANGPRAPSSKNPSKKGLQVSLLDDTVVAFDVEPSLKAEVLFKKVNTHLNLEEAEYFGLQFVDADANLCWLDPLKTINRQLKDAAKQAFKFRVMFYTPDPSGLQEYTRYLFTLQVRRDLLDGRLHCSSETGALLASYIVQGELGDYDPASHREGYLSGFQFVPSQTAEVEQQIVDYHVSHRGLSPADADRSMLEIARQLEMYGVLRYPVLDQEGAPLSIAVHHMGLLVYQGDRRINSFSWANIRKLSFKRKKFLLKLHPGIQENGDVVFFTMRSRDACKNFWKVVVSHHVFFRHKSAETLKRRGSSIKRGSRFRYSGRTRKQILDDSSGRPHTVDSETSRAAPVRYSRLEAGLESHHPPPVPPASPSYPVANHVPAARAPPTSVSSMSTDEGSYLVGNESRKTAAEDSEVEADEPAEDHVIADSSMSEAKVITLSYQYADDSNEENVDIFDVSENATMNGRLHSDVDEVNFPNHSGDVPKTSLVVNLETGIGADSAQDSGAFTEDSDAFEFDTSVTITSRDSELADEVNSMFQKINSEYSVSGRTWPYQMTSIQVDSEEKRGQLRHDGRSHGHGFRADAASHVPMASSRNDHEKQVAEGDIRTVADSEDQSRASLHLTCVPVEGEAQLREKLQDCVLESAALESPEL